MPGLILVLAPDLTIVDASDAYLAATMTRREEILGRLVYDVFPDNPADPKASGVRNLRASLDHVKSALVPDTMPVLKYDIERPAAAGGGFEERFWSPVNTPVLDESGALAFIINRVEDVTEFVRLRRLGSAHERVAEELRSRTAEMEAEVYRRAEELAVSNRELHRANAELRRSETFLDSIVENIPDMVFVKDARTLRFVRLNRAGEQLLGRPRDTLIGKSDYDLLPPAEADLFTARDREALAGGSVIAIPEEPIETAVNGLRYLHTKKIPIPDDAGRPAYLLGISRDITESKEAQARIRAAQQEAERANRAKTEFLSRMSHELRTPLNAILGFNQLLEMDQLTSDQRENVSFIRKGGRHLLELINEVLDIARIESGQMTISAEPVALPDVLDDAIALVRPLAVERSITLSAVATDCADHVLADRQRLKQILLNLLSNAIKYNRDGGSVDVRCTRVGSGRVRIDVADTGCGIASDHLDRLFRPFERLGAEWTSVEGTGMGLALSKGLAEAMGGSVSVASIVDVGTTFSLELALTESPMERLERVGPPPIEEPTPDASHKVVLHIEDNVSNQRLVERVLARRPGIRLLTAMQGGLGIDLARQHRPTLILLDLHLPDMAGQDVLRRLLAHSETRDIPIVVLSADATKSQIAHLLEAGAAGYLTKPLDVGEFLDQIDRSIGADPAVRP